MLQKRRSGRVSTKTSIGDEIAHLRGLDLKGLRSRWQSIFRRPPPDHLPRNLLFAIIAYRLQADRFGDLGSGPIKFLRWSVTADSLVALRGVTMDDLFLLTEAQMRRIELYFPLSHGIARVDDRRVISGIVFVIRNGLRWRDAPREYGPHKTIYNRFVRWSRLGVFNKIFAELARKAGRPSRLMIDSTHLKAHRTAASLLKKGLFPDVSGAPRAV